MWNLLKSHLDVVGPLRLSGCRGLLRALEGARYLVVGVSLRKRFLSAGGRCRLLNISLPAFRKRLKMFLF